MGVNDRFLYASNGRKLFFALVALTAAGRALSVLGDDTNSDRAAKASTSAPPPIVCLHTEYLPWRFEDEIKFRLMRELGRQALLIAARDELGLPTRDETLGELFPEAVRQSKQDLFIIVRSQYDGIV